MPLLSNRELTFSLNPHTPIQKVTMRLQTTARPRLHKIRVILHNLLRKFEYIKFHSLIMIKIKGVLRQNLIHFRVRRYFQFFKDITTQSLKIPIQLKHIAHHTFALISVWCNHVGSRMVQGVVQIFFWLPIHIFWGNDDRCVFFDSVMLGIGFLNLLQR